MPHHDSNRDLGTEAGEERPSRRIDHGASRCDLDRTISDPESWGAPLNYVELLTDRTVRSHIAKLIAQSTLDRPPRRR